MKVTIKDIAREAGVSVSMVSYVLNKSGRPTMERHKRILEIARKYNYVPDANARGLVTGVTNNIGLVVPQKSEEIFTQPFMVRCLREFSRNLAECHGWLSLCLGSDLSASSMRKYLANARVDGIVFMYAEDAGDIAELVEARRIPSIFFDRATGKGNASSIAVDDQAGLGMAIDHLRGLGHDRILFLSGRESAQRSAGDQRQAAYLAGIRRHGLAYDTVLYGGYTRQGGYAALKEYLDSGGSLPSAILAANDRMAWGVLRLLEERDIRVPGDISVVGFDDADEEHNEEVGLTTCRQPVAEMAQYCVRYINDCVESGDHRVAQEKMMPQFILRSSTAKMK